MVAHRSVTGSDPRITLSNRCSVQPLRIAAADIAVQASGGVAEPGTIRHLTFGGAKQTTLAAGEERVSDAAALRVEEGQNLLVASICPRPRHIDLAL